MPVGGGAMGKRMLRGGQGSEVGRGVRRGRWGGWTERKGGSKGVMATGRGRWGGDNGKKGGGGDWEGVTRRGRWGGMQRGGGQ